MWSCVETSVALLFYWALKCFNLTLVFLSFMQTPSFSVLFCISCATLKICKTGRLVKFDINTLTCIVFLVFVAFVLSPFLSF